MAEQKTTRARRALKDRGGATRAAAEGTVRGTGSTARQATNTVADTVPTDTLGHVQDEAVESAAGRLDMLTSHGEQPNIRDELGAIVHETAMEIFGPVARDATRWVARYMVKKGPQLVAQSVAPRVRDTLVPAIEEAGGPAELARGALSRVSKRRSGLLSKVGFGRARGDGAQPGTEGWRVPVEQSIDVAVPLETAYDQFTQFEDFAKVISDGETVEERPNERIAWKGTNGAQADGVITFHRLSDRLTRVMVTYDSQPQGILEKATSALRMTRRALKSDLVRFKAFAEMLVDDDAWDGDERTAATEGRRVAQPEELVHDALEEDDRDEADEAPEDEEHERPASRSPRVRTRPPARPGQKARQRR